MFKSKKNILGLDPDTFCPAPWLEGHIAVSGKLQPCCRFDDVHAYGNVKHEKFEDLINNDKAKQLRRDLFNGIKHPGCIGCWQDEKVIGNSYRLGYIEGWQYAVMDSLVNTTLDFEIDIKSLKKLDLRFDNKCNLKCRICGPHFSTSWFKDAKKLEIEGIDTGVEEAPYSISITDDLFQSLLKSLEGIKTLFFAGGEPLIQDKHYQILNYAIEKGYAKDMNLQYNTNFSTLQYKGQKVTDLWKKFNSVICTASLDDFEKRGEYQRKNLDWPVVVENRKELFGLENVFFNIYITVSIFNVFSILNFIEDWVDKGYINTDNPEGVNIGFLEGPRYLNLTNLTDEYKTRIVNTYDTFYNKHKDDDKYIHILHKLDSVTKFIKQERVDTYEYWVEQFLLHVNLLDKIREESFTEIFPEYQELYSQISKKALI